MGHASRGAGRLVRKGGRCRKNERFEEWRDLRLDITEKEGISEMVSRKIAELNDELPSGVEDANKIAEEIAEKHNILN